MEDHYSRFLSLLSDGASILDAGCGSGRDSLAFKKLGYKVKAFDASSAMVQATKSLAEVPVYQTTFQSAKFETLFNGIWACASLLHVPKRELSKVFDNLAAHLENDGIIYASFKYGANERQKGDRYFNDLTETSLEEHINYVSNPQKRLIGNHKIYDYYNKLIKLNKSKDEIHFHFHPPSCYT